MTKLARYLTTKFIFQSLSIFLVAALLVWITQTLRLFDIITAKGQDIFTLLGQATLTTPRLGMAIIYICMGIGLARVMRSLQDSKELHTIHSTRRTSALFVAIASFIFAGMIVTSLIANWVEPWSNKAYNKWNEEIAADLVGRALNPNRFSEVVPGLIIVIGGRLDDGTITDFFANDKRDEKTQRTYISKRANIIFDDKGYNISLIDGAMQFRREGGQFNEISFNRYDLSLDKLTGETGAKNIVHETDSLALILDGMEQGKISANVWRELNERFMETLRVLALCIFVASITIYPHAKRGKRSFPIEIIVLFIGLGEQVIGVSISKALPTGLYSSSLILITTALLIFSYKQFGYKLSGFKRAKA